jgi:hypothetical protein
MRNQEEVRKRKRRNRIGIGFLCVWSRGFGCFGPGLGRFGRRRLMVDLEAAVG